MTKVDCSPLLSRRSAVRAVALLLLFSAAGEASEEDHSAAGGVVVARSTGKGLAVVIRSTNIAAGGGKATVSARHQLLVSITNVSDRLLRLPVQKSLHIQLTHMGRDRTAGGLLGGAGTLVDRNLVVLPAGKTISLRRRLPLTIAGAAQLQVVLDNRSGRVKRFLAQDGRQVLKTVLDPSVWVGRCAVLVHLAITASARLDTEAATPPAVASGGVPACLVAKTDLEFLTRMSRYVERERTENVQRVASAMLRSSKSALVRAECCRVLAVAFGGGYGFQAAPELVRITLREDLPIAGRLAALQCLPTVIAPSPRYVHRATKDAQTNVGYLMPVDPAVRASAIAALQRLAAEGSGPMHDAATALLAK